MNRPLYESPQDLTNEASLVGICEREWNCKAHKLAIKYGVDFALVRHQIVCAFVEIKARTTPRDRYPTYMISLDKMVRAGDLYSATGLPVFLVVGWTDGAGWTSLHQRDWARDVRIGGRTDRGDAQDTEPVVHIPVFEFKVFS